MTAASTTRVDTYLRHLEELWGLQDRLWASFTPADWQRKHGKDWVFADVPYHLAYFDRMIAEGIERGENMPADEQHVFASMAELNRWNAGEFAKRPAGQTVEQSIAEARAARDRLRAAARGLTDVGLDDRAFMPLTGIGWATKELLLVGDRTHHWSEYMQLLIRAGRHEPAPSAEITHESLDFYMHFMPAVAKPEAAKGKPFTAVMEITGPGGGAWTISVADGKARTRRTRAEHPDVVMSQGVESFVKTFNKIHNPMIAMITRKIRVKGMLKMATFGKVFAEPKPDTRLAPGALVAALEEDST